MIDLRGADAFAAGHPAGAVNIGYGPRVGYWAGWVVPLRRASCCSPVPDQAEDASRQLLRLGFDAVVGYIEGGFARGARRRVCLARRALQRPRAP